jgi:hypothetical protein
MRAAAFMRLASQPGPVALLPRNNYKKKEKKK